MSGRGKARTPAKAKAARKNGAKGGRPKDSYAQLSDIEARLKKAIGHPLKMAALVQELAARAMLETIMGRGSPTLNTQIKQLGDLVLRAIPAEYLAELEARTRPKAKTRSRLAPPRPKLEKESARSRSPEPGDRRPLRG